MGFWSGLKKVGKGFLKYGNPIGPTIYGLEKLTQQPKLEGLTAQQLQTMRAAAQPFDPSLAYVGYNPNQRIGQAAQVDSGYTAPRSVALQQPGAPSMAAGNFYDRYAQFRSQPYGQLNGQFTGNLSALSSGAGGGFSGGSAPPGTTGAYSDISQNMANKHDAARSTTGAATLADYGNYPMSSIPALQQGYGAAQGYLGQAQGVLTGGQNALLDVFNPERQAGAQGLAAYQNAIFNPQAALESSPGYQFQLAEGQKAIDRAAAAQGRFGSGAYYKDLGRFSQGLASQEYGNRLNQLAGLAGVGSQANVNLANLNQQLIGQQSGLLQQRGQTAAEEGVNVGNIYQQNAIARANALIGAGTQANDLRAQGTNAFNQAIGGAAGFGANLLGQYGAYQMTQPQAPPVPPPQQQQQQYGGGGGLGNYGYQLQRPQSYYG